MAHTDSCMITDSRGAPLSRGVLESAPSENIWNVRVLDGGAARVLEHNVIQLIGMDDGLPGMTGSIIDSRGPDVLVVERIGDLDREARQNLRVPVSFRSFLYPVSCAWRGRRPIVSQDLSCGGIAFRCDPPPEVGEIVELAVPITMYPLLLRARILRRIAAPAGGGLVVSAAFVGMVREEEALVREAVFSQQIRNRTAG